MEKQLILERLQLTIDKLKTLKESQYLNRSGYGYVKTVDKNGLTSCGDVAGWYPIWFPDSGVKMCGYGIDFDFRNGFTTLSLYHGVNSRIVGYLFFRRNLHGMQADDAWTLQETINKWIACKYCIENDLISYV